VKPLVERALGGTAHNPGRQLRLGCKRTINFIHCTLLKPVSEFRATRRMAHDTFAHSSAFFMDTVAACSGPRSAASSFWRDCFTATAGRSTHRAAHTSSRSICRQSTTMFDPGRFGERAFGSSSATRRRSSIAICTNSAACITCNGVVVIDVVWACGPRRQWVVKIVLIGVMI